MVTILFDGTRFGCYLISSLNRSCSEVGNSDGGNDSTLKGYNRTPSHPALAAAGIPGYDPAYMMSTYPLSDLKPDPDELEQGIPQMELEASLSGIDSGSATLTREPNYDYQVLLILLYRSYIRYTRIIADTKTNGPVKMCSPNTEFVETEEISFENTL